MPGNAPRRTLRRRPSRCVRLAGMTSLLMILVACATPPPDTGPPPLQNMLGSTDELQLITEITVDLASRYGGKNLLVVLALEETLLTGFPAMGSKSPASTLQPYQQGAAEQVLRMQDAGLKVIAVASLGTSYQQQMQQELSRNGFDFQSSAWPPANGYPESLVLVAGARPVSYTGGVFLVDGQDQGQMLKALLEKAGKPYPQLIIFLDRSQSNLNAIMQAFSWSPTRVHAWRYTRKGDSADTP